MVVAGEGTVADAPVEHSEDYDASVDNNKFFALTSGTKEDGTLEKQWFCTCCDYKTIRKYNITRHMRKHSGLKVVKCLYCTESFANKPDLINHEQIVHNKHFI